MCTHASRSSTIRLHIWHVANPNFSLSSPATFSSPSHRTGLCHLFPHAAHVSVPHRTHASRVGVPAAPRKREQATFAQ